MITQVILATLLALFLSKSSGYAGQVEPAASPIGFNDPEFAQTWNRLDKVVQERPGEAGRGYTWGPLAPGTENIVGEPYNGTTRKVEYFDKARMEINNPGGNPADLYNVSTGLLVKELVTGARQDGDSTFTILESSQEQVAGDPNDNGANDIAPTYATFRNVGTFAGTENGQPNLTGSVINNRIDKAGRASYFTPPEKRLLSGYDEITRHNLADVFQRFGDQQGLVWNGSAYVQGSVFFGNPTYVLGRPLTEPYWIRTVLAGVETNVLVQLFERRVLTYTPTNPPGFKVEMGNVGQHYYMWRYLTNSGNEPTAPVPTKSKPHAAPASFPLGLGLPDVIPHQLVRTWDDRLYAFAIQGQSALTIKAYWTTIPGYPMTQSDFTGSNTLTENEKPLSVECAYDGLNTIHLLVNTNAGNLKDYIFDITTNSFKVPKLLATGNPTISGDYAGTSGVSAMFDNSLALQIAYWSDGGHITHRAYKYDKANDSLTPLGGVTQLATEGTANHPALAVSPLDNSLTVAWVSEGSQASRILTRTRLKDGNWNDPQIASLAPVWTSSSAGINIDQGPSLLIDANGTRHLTYIENYDNTNDYGRIHYAVDRGSGWSDQPLAAYSHDPALALASNGNLYIIGHGHPLNSTCKSMDDMCVLRKSSGVSNWEPPQIFAKGANLTSFDSSPSVKWSAIGFNRPETVEFIFALIPGGNYTSPQLYYGRLGSE